MTEPLVDIIIPTVPGREDDLQRCVASYQKLTRVPHRLIVISDSPSSGEGWIAGIEQGTAPYVHLTSDDVEITSDVWAQRCIEAADAGYIAAPTIYRPDGTVESCGGDMNAPHCLLDRVSPAWTFVDFAPTPFLSRAAMHEIGMLPIHYSCDVWLAYHGRALGYETVVRDGYELVHYSSPVRRGAGMAQGQRAAQDFEIMKRELGRVICAS